MLSRATLFALCSCRRRRAQSQRLPQQRGRAQHAHATDYTYTQTRSSASSGLNENAGQGCEHKKATVTSEKQDGERSVGLARVRMLEQSASHSAQQRIDWGEKNSIQKHDSQQHTGSRRGQGNRCREHKSWRNAHEHQNRIA